MPHAQKLKRWSRVLYFLTCLGMITVVGSVVFVSFIDQPTAASLQAAYPDINVAPQLSAGIVPAVILVGGLVAVAWLVVLDQMRRLFGCFWTGVVLTESVALHIQRIGWGLLLLAGAQVISVPVISLLLTSDNPAGERSLTVAINSEMLGFALAAGLMIVIGWAMREAAAIRAENQAFV